MSSLQHSSRRSSSAVRGESLKINCFCFVPNFLALLCFFFLIHYTSLTYHLDLHHQPTNEASTLTSPSSSSQIWTTTGDDPDGPVAVNRETIEASLEARGRAEEEGLRNVSHGVFHDKDMFLEDYKEMNRTFKIYVYPRNKNDTLHLAHAFLPVDFEPCGNYASESYFKRVLMSSHFVTTDPSEADLFFLPFSITRLRHDRRIGVEGIPDFIRRYITGIIHEYPYWNRTAGADHFYVACHSTGRSAMKKANEVKFNVIQVVCSSSYFLSGYIAHKDTSIPQIWPRKGITPSFVASRRKKLAFFAGSLNSPVREKLLQSWDNDSDISVHFGRTLTPYSDALLGRKFCLHVKGFEVNTARIADAIHYGCIPVIIANHYDLPFADILSWKSFSLVVATLGIPLLKEILCSISLEDYIMLQSNVMKVRKHFRWNSNPCEYDAFYMVMYELWLRRSVVRFPGHFFYFLVILRFLFYLILDFLLHSIQMTIKHI